MTKRKKQPKAGARGKRGRGRSQAKGKRTPGKTKRRAPMSKQSNLSSAEVSILGKMATLDPESPRYRVLEAALAFKSSWIILGEHLSEVLKTGLWKAWGFKSFERYCGEESFVSSSTARKLVKSFNWLGEEAPELLPSTWTEDGRVKPPKD